MTRTEVLHRFLIPLAVLEEYELWELCRPKGQDKAEQQYDDSDIERLSLIMTLNDIGFTKTEIKEYMHLQLSPENTKQERLAMLDRKRSESLDEIHTKEIRLNRLDYLRHEILKA